MKQKVRILFTKQNEFKSLEFEIVNQIKGIKGADRKREIQQKETERNNQTQEKEDKFDKIKKKTKGVLHSIEMIRTGESTEAGRLFSETESLIEESYTLLNTHSIDSYLRSSNNCNFRSTSL